jgi:hypothetical protein
LYDKTLSGSAKAKEVAKVVGKDVSEGLTAAYKGSPSHLGETLKSYGTKGLKAASKVAKPVQIADDFSGAVNALTQGDLKEGLQELGRTGVNALGTTVGGLVGGSLGTMVAPAAGTVVGGVAAAPVGYGIADSMSDFMFGPRQYKTVSDALTGYEPGGSFTGKVVDAGGYVAGKVADHFDMKKKAASLQPALSPAEAKNAEALAAWKKAQGLANPAEANFDSSTTANKKTDENTAGEAQAYTQKEVLQKALDLYMKEYEQRYAENQSANGLRGALGLLAMSQVGGNQQAGLALKNLMDKEAAVGSARAEAAGDAQEKQDAAIKSLMETAPYTKATLDSKGNFSGYEDDKPTNEQYKLFKQQFISDRMQSDPDFKMPVDAKEVQAVEAEMRRIFEAGQAISKQAGVQVGPLTSLRKRDITWADTTFGGGPGKPGLLQTFGPDGYEYNDVYGNSGIIPESEYKKMLESKDPGVRQYLQSLLNQQ